MSLTLKVVLAVIITVVIDFVARSKQAHLSAVLPLFPTFALVAVYSVMQHQPAAMQKFTLTGVGSLFAYAAFLIVAFHASGSLSTGATIGAGLLAWFVVAATVILVLE